MPKIYLSPARHTPDNACAYDKKCGENVHNDQYLDELEVFLAACDFEYRRNKSLDAGGTMQTAVAESNAWGPDLHYISHTNAFDGSAKGCRPIVYPQGDGRRWAEIILKHRAKIYPYDMKINERADLYELRATKAVAIYEEHVFHDNPEDAKWFHENMREVARHTCKALCEIFDVAFVDPYVVLGDVDRDDRLTVSDVIALRRLIMTGSYDQIADLTKDGRLTVADIIELRREIMSQTPNEPKPQPQPEPAPQKPVLKQGAKGDEVKELQTALSELGLYKGAIDGIFGPLTLDAVKAFQKSNGLAVDGIVGPKTWQALSNSKTKATPNPYNKPGINLKTGSMGEGVKWVQFELQKRGYDLGPYGIDGVFGSATDRAVRQFQRDNNLTVDGIVGVNTRRKLEEV